MRFIIPEEERVLPFAETEMLQSICDQLKHGTIFVCNRLGNYLDSQGIRISTRRQDRSSTAIDTLNKCYYKVSNDERRRLLRTLKENGFRT